MNISCHTTVCALLSVCTLSAVFATVSCNEPEPMVKLIFDHTQPPLLAPPGSYVFILRDKLPDTINVTSNAYSHQSQHSDTRVMMAKFVARARSASHRACSLATHCYDYARTHKLRFIGAGIGIGYAAVCGRVWYLARKLAHPDCWSLWRRGLSLPELLSLSEEDLMRDLSVAIYERYVTGTHGKIDAQYVPFMLFLSDLAAEESTLKAYNSWAGMKEYLGFVKALVPIHTALASSIAERLDRIACLRSRVKRYLAGMRTQ